MDITPLLLQLIDVRPQISDLVLQPVHLIHVRPQRLVESLHQQVRRRLTRSHFLRRHIIDVTSSAATAVAIGHRSTSSRAERW